MIRPILFATRFNSHVFAARQISEQAFYKCNDFAIFPAITLECNKLARNIAPCNKVSSPELQKKVISIVSGRTQTG